MLARGLFLSWAGGPSGRLAGNPQNVDLSAVPAGTEILPENFTSPDSLAYAYDGVQNRTSHVKTTAGTPVTTAYARQAGAPEFDAEMNQYTQTQEGANPAVGYLYDANGNLTSDGTRNFLYDFKNRLVEVRLVAGNVLVAQYSFDNANRRVMRTLPGGTTVYAYDGIQCVEERDQTNAITRQYVWGPGIDELVQEQTPADTWFAHENSIGSVCALTDSAGNVVERYQYDPFGNTTVTLNGNTGNRYRFHAAYFDDETGLIHMRNRAYHPGLGRFIQRDPIGGWGDWNNFGNALSRAGNDSVNRLDPFGLDSLEFTGDTVIHYDDSGAVVGSYPATSGQAGTSDTSIPDRGPIPEGEYELDPGEVSEGGFLRNLRGDWGNYRAPLDPKPETDTKGRKGMYIHGGKKPGSKGCIDLGEHDKDLLPKLKGHKGKVPVSVKYPPGFTNAHPPQFDTSRGAGAWWIRPQH